MRRGEGGLWCSCTLFFQVQFPAVVVPYLVSRAVVSLDVIDDRSSQESNDRDPHYLALLGRATYIHSTSTRDQAQRSGTADGWERKPGHRALALAIAKGEEGEGESQDDSVPAGHRHIHAYIYIHTYVRACSDHTAARELHTSGLSICRREEGASFYIGTDIHGIGRWPCPCVSRRGREEQVVAAMGLAHEVKV
jgi:hypothetical protein